MFLYRFMLVVMFVFSGLGFILLKISKAVFVAFSVCVIWEKGSRVSMFGLVINKVLVFYFVICLGSFFRLFVPNSMSVGKEYRVVDRSIGISNYLEISIEFLVCDCFGCFFNFLEVGGIIVVYKGIV